MYAYTHIYLQINEDFFRNIKKNACPNVKNVNSFSQLKTEIFSELDQNQKNKLNNSYTLSTLCNLPFLVHILIMFFFYEHHALDISALKICLL